MMPQYFNNTGWEVGEHLLLPLPGTYLMSVIIEDTHYYTDSLDKVQISPKGYPHHARINCMVVKTVKDADNVMFQATVYGSDRIYETQEELFQYCAECRDDITELLNKQPKIKENEKVSN